MIRYPFYAMKLLNQSPKILVWLRYTQFIPLYIIGGVSEFLCVFYPVSNEEKFSDKISQWIWISYLALGYGFGLPYLYFYMLGQRKKVLNPKVRVD